MNRKEKFVGVLIDAYSVLRCEKDKAGTAVSPKFKDYVVSLFNYTKDYAKLVFVESEFFLEQTGYSSMPDLLGNSLFRYALQSGYPADFMEEMKLMFSPELYSTSLHIFYGLMQAEIPKGVIASGKPIDVLGILVSSMKGRDENKRYFQFARDSTWYKLISHAHSRVGCAEKKGSRLTRLRWD